MNTFEEHQLFIPIISDSRFAPKLANECYNGRRIAFNRCALDAMHKVGVEAGLSMSTENRNTVQRELWEYYKRLEDEERTARNNAVYAAEGFDAKANQTEREVSGWEQHAARVCREAFGMTDTYSSDSWKQAIARTIRMNNPPQQIPKESHIMATPTFNTITYVSGKPLSELTNEDLINAIKACEKEIESLREVRRTRTKVAAKIAELDSTADKIRDALDARA